MSEQSLVQPRPGKDWALFLDLDGTLVDLAPRPDAVTVPDGLIDDLKAVQAWLGGALAIVSGRPMNDLDRLLGRCAFDVAAEHGAVLCRAGRLEAIGRTVPADWRLTLVAAAQSWPGALVEVKTCGITVHYRTAPQFSRGAGGSDADRCGGGDRGRVPLHSRLDRARAAGAGRGAARRNWRWRWPCPRSNSASGCG